MNYPKMPELSTIVRLISEYSTLKHEYGADGVGKVLHDTEKMLKQQLETL